MQEAVQKVDWIQESVPENLIVKQSVFADIQTHCPSEAVIGLSTSGFKPTELQKNSKYPDQILVAHPFNPVYLLPFIEVVPGAQTGLTILKKLKRIWLS